MGRDRNVNDRALCLLSLIEIAARAARENHALAWAVEQQAKSLRIARADANGDIIARIGQEAAVKEAHVRLAMQEAKNVIGFAQALASALGSS